LVTSIVVFPSLGITRSLANVAKRSAKKFLSMHKNFSRSNVRQRRPTNVMVGLHVRLQNAMHTVRNRSVRWTVVPNAFDDRS